MVQAAHAVSPEAPVATLRLANSEAQPATIRRLVVERLREGHAERLRFLRARLRSREDAEDVLQEFALKAVQGAARLSDPNLVDPWLAVTLRNALFDRYRRNAARGRLLETARSEPPDAHECGDDLDRPLRCLSAALGGLKPETTTLLRRAELEETPLRILAADLEITANNAGVRVHRARETLRRAMQERCAACAARCDIARRFVGRSTCEIAA